jgi:outer membrane receptor protein involved in Fe transport
MQSVSPRLLLLPLLCHGLTFEVRAQDAVEAGADDSIETVQVLGRREGNYTIITEDAQKLVEMPGALGDPLGAITALPGVLSPAGGGAPAVRGSSPADNRYYIDGMPAGYIFHAFNTSIFDENIVRDFSLYPAGFGAEYANATGAVFDIRLRDPARQSLLTTVNASFLRAGVLVESGLTENSAFYLSLRRGLVEFIYPEDDEPNEDGIRVQSAPMDSDYVFKYLWSSEPGNRLSFNLVGARDGAGAEFTEKSRLAQENPDFAGDAFLKDAFDSQSLVWDRAWSGVKLNLVLAHYENRDKLYWGDNYFHQMKLENLMFKGALAALLGRHELSLGTEANRNQYNYATRRILFVCTDLEPDCLNRRRELVEFDQRVEMKDTSVYLIDRWTPGETVELESGVQWTRDDYTDQSFVHPRFAASWRFQPQLALTASAGSYNRFPDLELVMPGIGNPALHPYEAEHYTLGLKGEFRDHWTWSAEFYHKNLKRLPLALGEDEDQFYSNQVKGEAQGVDLFLNRNRADNWYGWMSLSYATSERTNQRTGETRDYTLDTPIVLNLVANYRFHPRWDAGFRLTAKSGQATTEIIGVQENPAFPGHYSPVYGEPYADRLPFYARLDFRVSWEFEAFGNPGSLFTDVLNILNRKNVTSVGLDYEKVEETGELHLEREEEFGILGSVGVSFSF